MELVAQSNLTSLAFMAAMILIIGFLLWRSQRHFARKDTSWMPEPAPPPTKPQKPSYHRNNSEEVTQWEVEMHELARDLSGQLDSKMNTLSHLVREADRAAARLETALEAMTQRHGDASPAQRPARLDASGLDLESRDSFSPPGQADGLRAAGPSDDRERPAKRPSKSSERDTSDRRYEEIYLLADYGFTPGDIAQRVGMPIGEIQLILGLRSKR